MKPVLIAILIALFISFPAFADEDDDDFGGSAAEMRVVVDISLYGGDAAKVKKAILLAFLNRGWVVDSAEPNRYIGHYGLDRNPMKAQFLLKDSVVTITSVKGAPQPRPAWLGNLRKDFLVFLVQQVDYNS